MCTVHKYTTQYDERTTTYCVLSIGVYTLSKAEMPIDRLQVCKWMSENGPVRTTAYQKESHFHFYRVSESLYRNSVRMSVTLRYCIATA